ncbi:MAG: RES domain-containing protein [Egibacteraceae bacterium]
MPRADGAVLRRLRTRALPAGTLLRRGHKVAHPDSSALVPGEGNTRFAPLDGTGHVYVAATTFAAMLESAFHDAAPPQPRIPLAVLAQWGEAEVELRQEVRLIDLRDDELDCLGIDRSALVATSAAHYPCTRVWARALKGRRVGGRDNHGLVWHSRQAELHARAMQHRPALHELIDAHPAEVAVLWSPPAAARLLRASGEGLGQLDCGEGERYVTDLVALLGIVSQE